MHFANHPLNSTPGTYALLLEIREPTELRVGRLGHIHFDSPFYLYFGSAFGPGGLGARLKHHLQPTGRVVMASRKGTSTASLKGTPLGFLRVRSAGRSPEGDWRRTGRAPHRQGSCLLPSPLGSLEPVARPLGLEHRRVMDDPIDHGRG